MKELNNMFLKLEDEMLKRIQDITLTDYEAKLGYVPAESVTEMIADLLLEIDRLEERITDIEKDREDNYKPFTTEELYGVSDKDFL